MASTTDTLSNFIGGERVASGDRRGAHARPRVRG
jgi:hypothetical protein